MSWDDRPFGPDASPPVPPPPSHPPTAGPPPPGAALRGVAAGLLNLSGLGLGYALMRRWFRAVLCWAATGALLLVALPADPDGPPAGPVVAYAVVLAAAAVDGARIARRTAVGGSWRPVVAAGAGLLLLAVPAGGVVLYGSAQDEAVERMLLDRLGEGDRTVRAASGRTFDAARADYRSALAVYRDLGEDHPGSRAGRLVPARLHAYYEAVATPYRQGRSCEAVAPLTYLRTVPESVDPKLLGDLADWPDGPLAESLYACGVSRLGGPAVEPSGGELAELLRTFPRSAQAGKVGPAVSRTISEQVAAVGKGSPCAATESLRELRTTVAAMPVTSVSSRAREADRGIENGMYACGVDQFRSRQFAEARRTLTEFAATYGKDSRRARARDIAIAAEIAAARPAAGERLPPAGSPGGSRMELVISNDAPSGVEILYTGPVTGRVSLKACGSCNRFASEASGSALACKAGGGSYPKVRLRLPAGEYHFLYKHGTGTGTGVESYASGSHIQPGYTYTSCTYVVDSPYGIDPPSASEPVSVAPVLLPALVSR
ncbi:hypothetical protein LRD69_22555 [Streptomyces sp. JH14]|uniref:hypothetical protein n=1 Tax=Streptomyces sp. JH14 TaxID=2793630 RepID=UPI0023F684F9|nr:hypothetical protein [Streptomyces sp. JH14]MDF6044876.1 hypothetical protein [Streptomyces sp. JH14]